MPELHRPVLVGEKVPPSWRGEVRGVFGHAANVFLRPPAEGEPADPLLLTLLDSPRNMGERCVALDPEVFERLRRAWSEDASSDAEGKERPVEVRCEGGVLDCGPDLPRLNLGLAERWHTPSLVVRGPASGRLLRRAARMLGEAEHPEPWGDEVYRRFDLWSAGTGTLRDVVGVGPGLTPAGDDMLIGFLCGLHASRAYSAEALRRLHELRENLPPLLDRTTEVSRAFLDDALAGRFHQPLAALCLALHPGAAPRRAMNNADEGLRCSLDDALAFGAGSGREGAYGLLAALWLVRPWRDAR